MNGMTNEVPTEMDSAEVQTQFMVQNFNSHRNNGYEEFTKKLEKQAKERLKIEKAENMIQSNVVELGNEIIKGMQNTERAVNNDLEEDIDSKLNSTKHIGQSQGRVSTQLVSKVKSVDYIEDASSVESPEKYHAFPLNNKYSPQKSPRLAQINLEFQGVPVKGNIAAQNQP